MATTACVVHRCKNDCGFKGGFQQVSAHECYCTFSPSKAKHGQGTQQNGALEGAFSGLGSERMDREEQARQEIRKKYEEAQEELRRYEAEVQRQEILLKLQEAQEEVKLYEEQVRRQDILLKLQGAQKLQGQELGQDMEKVRTEQDMEKVRTEIYFSNSPAKVHTPSEPKLGAVAGKKKQTQHQDRP